MEDKITIAIVIIFSIIGVLIYFAIRFYNESKKSQGSLKNELLDLKKRYDDNIKIQQDRFSKIDTKLSKIPNVSKSINSKIQTEVNNQKQKLEKYVEDAFKKVGKDILFESIIDEHISKTISLQDILKGEKDKYTGLFNTLTKNMVYINDSTKTTKDDIASFKKEIQTSFDKVYNEAEKYNKNYLKGKKKADDFEKRISNLEDYTMIHSNDSKSSSSSSKSSISDTFDDFSFEIDNKEIQSLSVLHRDEPTEDSTYQRYKGIGK